MDGQDVATLGVAARRRVGYLPENVTLYHELTVAQYLDFVAGAKGIAGRRARRHAVGEVVDRCALHTVTGKYAGTLSKGYRQRVGLAQALLGDPDILVLDEPTVGLDPVQTVELRDVLRAVAGRTVLLSTHILHEASLLCSRIVIVSRGRLVAEDTAAGLAARVDAVARLQVRVEGGAPDAVSAVLTKLPGVTRAELLPPDGAPGLGFVVWAPDPAAAQRAVAPAVVAQRWRLLELMVTPPTLEDLFVRLVTGHA